MSSMPERDTPDQPGGGTEQSARSGDRGTPYQGSAPGQEQLGGAPAGGLPAQPEPGQPAGQQGGWATYPETTPVSEAETRVTWRRIFQYWIDAFFVSVIPYLVSIPFDRSASTIMNIIGGLLYVVLFVLIGLWYWVIRPHSHNGQTFAMKWFGLRVVSKDGGPASLLQLFVRWISLLFDSAPWMWPFTGLLGLIVILCSRYRQRIGDHFAKTVVIRTAGTWPAGAAGPGDYGRAGTAQPTTVQPEPGAGQETGAGRQPGGDQAAVSQRGVSGGPDDQGRGDSA
jgi:uncharacterized RDD family membrane protein YckC